MTEDTKAPIPFRCIIQDGQIPSATQAVLQDRLDEFSTKAFGATTRINWLVVPRKAGFTAGDPSTCSFVLALSNAKLSKEVRTGYLRHLCDLWMDETGCSLDEVVAAIGDPHTA